MVNYRSLNYWSRGVAANMRPCQGRDRGFEPRRGRSYNILLKPYTRPKEAILIIEYREERNNKAKP